jgi:hypothetical protein
VKVFSKVILALVVSAMAVLGVSLLAQAVWRTKAFPDGITATVSCPDPMPLGQWSSCEVTVHNQSDKRIAFCGAPGTIVATFTSKAGSPVPSLNFDGTVEWRAVRREDMVIVEPGEVGVAKAIVVPELHAAGLAGTYKVTAILKGYPWPGGSPPDNVMLLGRLVSSQAKARFEKVSTRSSKVSKLQSGATPLPNP